MALLPIFGASNAPPPSNNSTENTAQSDPPETNSSTSVSKPEEARSAQNQGNASSSGGQSSGGQAGASSQSTSASAPTAKPSAAPQVAAKVAEAQISAEPEKPISNDQLQLGDLAKGVDQDAELQAARAQAEMVQKSLAMQRVIESVQPLKTGPIGVSVSQDPLAKSDGNTQQVAVPDAIPDQLPPPAPQN